MIGQRLRLARTGAGLSLRELEARLGNRVTAQALSKYEQDRMMPSSGVLLALATALDVPVSYLLAPADLELEDVEFRRADLPKKDLARVEAGVLDRVHRYLTVEDVLAASSGAWRRPSGAPFPVRTLADAEQAARSVREEWQLGLDPIPNVAEFFEEKGIKVVALALPRAIDGLSCKVTWRKHEQVPVIVVSAHEDVSGERQRFTLSHELGHLLLECADGIDVEKASHRFAGAFLMPVEVLWREVGKQRSHLSLPELVELKKVFGVSMQMITYRCHELGILSTDAYRALFRHYKDAGWRDPPYEPHRLDPERPQRFERLCYRAFSEGLISESKAAELLEIAIPELESRLQQA